MDLSQIERLKEQQRRELQFCEDKITQWKKFKEDYEALKLRIETLPDALSYDITVPFGPNAFTMGQLVHTNEVMVLLGDNWFVEVSAKQAVAIADRRIAHCENMLEDLDKERQQLNNWLHYINEVSGDNLVEIVEEYDEEKEKEWREQHSKNVKAYREKLSKERKYSCSSEETVSNSDDDYISKLDKLELTETPEQLESSESEENVKDTAEQNEQFDIEINNPKEDDRKKESKSKPLLKLNVNCSNNETVIAETESGEDDGSKSDDVNSNAENCFAEPNEKHVRWQDLSKHSIKKITFKHSKSKHHTHKHHVKKQDSSESEMSPQPLINSPSDIYKHFGSLFLSTSPKSILKVKNSPTSPEVNDTFFTIDDIVPKEDSPGFENENIVNPFTGQVYEKSSPIHIPDKKSSSSRKVSQFKSSRKNKKRLSH